MLTAQDLTKRHPDLGEQKTHTLGSKTVTHCGAKQSHIGEQNIHTLGSKTLTWHRDLNESCMVVYTGVLILHSKVAGEN